VESVSELETCFEGDSNCGHVLLLDCTLSLPYIPEYKAILV